MKEMRKKRTPVILFATERSGTNLLRAILSSHSQIASPPPAGVIGVMAPSRYRYLFPAQDRYLKEMVQDAVALTGLHLNPWDVQLASEDVINRMSSASYWEMFKVLNEIYADEKGCSHWFSKEPQLFNWGYEILAHMPNARFICMVRDGRDVAASMLKGGVHEVHILGAAQRWRREQERILLYLSDPLFCERARMVRYEDLISDTEAVMRSLAEFVGLPFETGMLEFYKAGSNIEHSGRSRFWENVSKPIMASNKSKYRENLSKRQIAIFESVCSEVLAFLGYEIDMQGVKELSFTQRAICDLQGRLLRAIRNSFSSDAEREKREAWVKLSNAIRKKTFK